VNLLRTSPSLANPNVKQMRAAIDQMGEMFQPDQNSNYQTVLAGSVHAEWITAPNADTGRVMLYLHGGGFVSGSIATHRALVARLSLAAQSRALALDYRLAPEHPFPAAVEDSVEAYRWLLAKDVNPARIIVAGDSAGGGLGVSTLVAIRDAGLPTPRAGVLLSPMVDLEATGESMTTKAAEDPIVKKDLIPPIVQLYLNGQNPRDPLASPLYADLSCLPPILIQVGTAEVLLNDSTRLAARASKAGVQVTLEQWDKMIHVWQLFASILDEGQQAIDKIGEFIRTNVK
jgi:monoterpene epsilon-lactone hydrolase